MAYQKRQPKFEVDAKTAGGTFEYPDQTVALSDADFGTFVRWVKNASLDVALGIQAATIANMKRLKMKAKGVDPVVGVPDGSDQVDIGSLVAWASSIKLEDSAAKDQLKKLAATVNARVG